MRKSLADHANELGKLASESFVPNEDVKRALTTLAVALIGLFALVFLGPIYGAAVILLVGVLYIGTRLSS